MYNLCIWKIKHFVFVYNLCIWKIKHFVFINCDLMINKNILQKNSLVDARKWPYSIKLLGSVYYLPLVLCLWPNFDHKILHKKVIFHNLRPNVWPIRIFFELVLWIYQLLFSLLSPELWSFALFNPSFWQKFWFILIIKTFIQLLLLK